MTSFFVPKESRPGETRVAATPDTVKRLVQSGVEVFVERGAGVAARFTDEALSAAGAKLGGSEGWSSADVVLKVSPPTEKETASLREGATLVAFVNPAQNLTLVEKLRDRKVSVLAMELIPRITRAQSMDALSSQATIAGYKAVLLAAAHLPKLCPLMMTAAGTVPPAKCVVFGAGVAGLQAIATSKRLGCTVEATDVRAAAKEQVQSLGARFIEVPGAADMEGAGGYAKEQSEDSLRRQREEVAKRVAEADIVITTAQVPGKKAPVLVTGAMVRSMRPGAVIVDLAVESGGNCELSVLGQVVERHGVTIVGTPNLPATVPQHASELYAKNVLALVKPFISKEGKFVLDLKDEVVAGTLLCHAGEILHAPTAAALTAGSTGRGAGA